APQPSRPGSDRRPARTPRPPGAPPPPQAIPGPGLWARSPAHAPRHTATRARSGRSLAEPLQRLGISGQLFIQHPIEQLGSAMGLDILPDRLAGHLLHWPALMLGSPAQRTGL